ADERERVLRAEAKALEEHLARRQRPDEMHLGAKSAKCVRRFLAWGLFACGHSIRSDCARPGRSGLARRAHSPGLIGPARRAHSLGLIASNASCPYRRVGLAELPRRRALRASARPATSPGAL